MITKTRKTNAVMADKTDDFSDFSFELVPNLYALCFTDSCPMAASCMRHLAAEHVPDDRERGNAIYPTALKDGQCAHFKQVRKLRMAWGLDGLMRDIKHRDNRPLRSALISCLGSRTTLFRAQKGEHLLTPTEQEQIIQIFKRYGYTDNLLFDHYVTAYDFE